MSTKPRIRVRAVPLTVQVAIPSRHTGYFIQVETTTGVWEETYVTEAEKDAFIRGVNAGASMFGEYLDPPEDFDAKRD
jgi:hypothetical protein